MVLVLSKVLPGQTGAATALYWAVSDSSFNLMGETVNTQTTTAFSGKGNLVFRIIILILPKKICYKIFLYRSEGPSPDHHLFIGCSQYLSPGKI